MSSGQAGRPATEANEFIHTVLDEVLVRTRRNAFVVHEILRRSCGWRCEKICVEVASIPLDSFELSKSYLIQNIQWHIRQP